MGNNNSHHSQPSSVDVVRRPPNRPHAPPSSRPLSELGPRGPSYLDPENQVLPKELPSILKLRPVSMELSKYNPNYENIYSHDSDEENFLNGNLDDNDNNIDKAEQMSKSSSPSRPPPPVPNGHINHLNNSVGVGSDNTKPVAIPNGVANGVANGHGPNNANVKNAPYRPSHRRQMSLGLANTILEEPEESIDSRVKLDPLMQSFPGVTGPSLPVKNNFNLDYSYQCTYVQLAEHRRNKTIEDLEKKTGKKLSDLSADLNEHTDKPFMRETAARISTRSMGSGGSAVSSNKKKKAPAPPGPAGSKSPRNPQKPYSVDNEPPIDYDLESPRRPVTKYNNNSRPTTPNGILPRYSAVSPKVSRVPPIQSKVPAPPAPPPPKIGGSQSPRKPSNLSRNNSMNETPQMILRKTPDVKRTTEPDTPTEGQVPWLLEIKTLSEAKAARRQQSQTASDTPELDDGGNEVEMDMDAEETSQTEANIESKPKLVFASANEGQTDDGSAKRAVERSNSLREKETLSPKLQRHSSTTTYDRLATTPKMQRQASAPANGDPVRRLSSLLQHDIKAAGNAKCLKLVKQTTPVTPKPKDAHTVFREQLQKACAARDRRSETDGTIDEKLQRNNSEASFELGEVLDDEVAEVKINKMKEAASPPDVLPKPPRYHKNVSVNRSSSSYGKAQRGSSFTGDKSPVTNGQRRQQGPAMSLDWTPEHDLESDDNLSDREAVTMRKGSSDGFKSTIVPNQINELKLKKSSKKEKKMPNAGNEEVAPKNKFGSVKKFKKSMHKGVKNAFGSISKASGKLLRKQRAEDLETVEDAPKNWSLSANRNSGHSNSSSSRQQRYAVPVEDDTDSDSDQRSIERAFSDITYEHQNGNMDSDESSDNGEPSPQLSKRASAYKASRSHRIQMVEQDLEDEEDDQEVEMRSQRFERSKAKDKKKKKYQSYDPSSMKRKDKSLERSKEETYTGRDRDVDDERRKQLEIELEMHKLREAETRERLKRLETAHLQQQLTAQLLQQQQQQQQHQHPPQNLGMLGVAPLPPAGNFPNYAALPDPNHPPPNYPNLFSQQMPPNGFPPNYNLYSQSNPYMNGSSIQGVSYDLNDYMRMMGLQNPPTSQQMAFFLNNMTVTGGQPFERKSNPLVFDMYNQQYPTANLGYQPPMDTGSLKKQGFQTWASTPNIHNTANVQNNNNNVPLSDFVASYTGANTNTANKKDATDEKTKRKSCNPLYDSDNSDEGLSPQKSVARAQVKDYRPVPNQSESGKFMRQYASQNIVSHDNDSVTHNNNNNRSNLNVRTSKSERNISQTTEDELRFLHRQHSVSPTNSVSTVDSAIMTSPSVTLSTPSSPSQSIGTPGSPMMRRSPRGSGPSFRTVVDLSTPTGSTTQIIDANGDVHF